MASEWLHQKVEKHIRPIYMGLIGNLTREELISLLNGGDIHLLTHLIQSYLLKTKVKVDGKYIANAIVESDGPDYDHHVELYEYGFKGNLLPEARPRVTNGKLEKGNGFVATDASRQSDALIELINADFSESYALDGCSIELEAAHVLVANTARVRSFIDCCRLRPDEYQGADITLHELALLAQMKITTIRNRANPKDSDSIKTYKRKGDTRVLVEDALAWLERNTKYQPTVFPLEPYYLDKDDTSTFSEQEIKDAIFSHLGE